MLAPRTPTQAGTTDRKAVTTRLGPRLTLIALIGTVLAVVATTAVVVLRVDATAAGDGRLLVVGVALLVVLALLAAAQIAAMRRARQRAVTALRQSEQRARLIVEDQSELISLATPDGRLLYTNPAYSRFFGRSPEQLEGTSLYDLVTPADREAVRTFLDGVMRSDRVQHTENRAAMPDGSERWIAWTNRRQVDLSGAPVLHSVGRDITERVVAEQALRDLNAILDSSPDYIIQADWRGRLLYWNPAARDVLGMAPDEPPGQHTFDEFNTPETNRRFAEEITPTVKARGVWVGECEVVVAHGRRLLVNHMVIGHRDGSGRVARYSAVMRDVTAAIQARRELALQAATLQSIIEAMPAMVAVVGADGRYRYANSAFERWLRRRRDQVVGQTVEAVLGAEEFAIRQPWMQRALAGETVAFERSFLGAGPGRHLGITYVPLHGGNAVEGFVVVAHDITSHKDEQVRLARLAERDPLTGLLNRAGFEHFLTRGADKGEAAALAVLYIDLDHFKPVNDRHGHAVGDQVLRQFAERLQALVRPSDAVARLGGDEFAIALNAVRAREHAERVADEILRAARAPFVVDALTLQIGASVGVAFNAEHDTGWQRLVQHADARLYEAKAAGRGRRG